MHKASKLFKLKKWLTLHDAAQYLTSVLGEPLGPPDVLRLALEGQLKLSVRFVDHELARRAFHPSLIEREARQDQWAREPLGVVDVGDGKGERRAVLGLPGDLTPFMWVQQTTTTLSAGEYDIPMIGAERLDVEREYERLSGGTPSALSSLGGAFVESETALFQLLDGRPLDEEQRRLFLEETGHEPDPTSPAACLPASRTFIVRVGALTAFTQKLDCDHDGPLDKPVAQRERTSLLTIIAALAKEADIDVSMPSKAAGQIEALTIEQGTRIAVRTVLGHLNRIQDALERSRKHS